MMKQIATGAAAGAVGTAVLNISTYADMAGRGRPASQIPTQVVEKVSRKAHVRALDRQRYPEKKVESRLQGLGALTGYVAGIGVGIGYAFAREHIPDKAAWAAPIGVGVAAMLAGDLPPIALRLTDPRKWGKEGWMADIVPHMLYGVATVGAYEALRGKDDKAVDMNEA